MAYVYKSIKTNQICTDDVKHQHLMCHRHLKSESLHAVRNQSK